jgi:hypothetical protein
MQRNDGARARVADDSGAAAPTPLFLAYLGALVLAAAAAFHGGFGTDAVVDFLLLAAIVTGSVLVLFAVLMVWAARAGHRAAALAAARPGALVLRGGRAHGLRRAVRALRTEVPFLPIGLTLLADDTGFEVWCGSAEHPVRLGRAPWEAISDIRVTRITRLGRATGGITVTVLDGADGAGVELPFAVLGSGLGGIAVPAGPELEQLVCALRTRRAASVEA